MMERMCLLVIGGGLNEPLLHGLTEEGYSRQTSS